MQNNLDTYLQLLDEKRSAGEADSGARLNLALAALAAPMNQTAVRSAWNAGRPQPLVAGDVDVFLVEDDPSAVGLVRTLLNADGIDLLAVGSFHEAILALRQTHPRLLLVDLGLPDGNGLEIAHLVRRWNYFPRIPIVALTASSEKAGEAWQAGFSGFIPKPFVAMTFRSMVRSWLAAPLTRTKGVVAPNPAPERC